MYVTIAELRDFCENDHGNFAASPDSDFASKMMEKHEMH